MATTIRGVVQGGVVVLPAGAELPEGAEVEVRVATERLSAVPSDNGHGESNAEPRRPMTEEEFHDYMVARGLVRPRRPLTDEELRRIREWRPIVVEGKPLSEIIIENRR